MTFPAERPPLAVESPRLRVQRFGSPLDAFKLLARLVASVAVAVGVITVVSPFRDDVGVAVAVVLGGFFIAIAVLASVPLGAAMVWTWLFALLTRSRAGVLAVGRSLCVERSHRVASFAPADVVSVGGDPELEPGWVTIRMESGDVIRAEVTDPAAIGRIADAVADAGARGPWIAPLYAPSAPRAWPRWTAVGLTLVAAPMTLVAASSLEQIGALSACAGLLLWLTVLRPGPARRRLAIGTDGIDLRGEGDRRFIPFTRIDRVEPTPPGADLVLATGERFPLAVVPPAQIAKNDPSSAALALSLRRRASLIERLQAGLGASEALAGEERLACQGRSVSDWREAVRGLVNEVAPSYRVAQLPTEQAARIVEKGRAAPEARIGAALALAGSADEALRQRLRIAVEECADEATQVAILQALEDWLDPWTLARVQRVGERR